MVGEPRQQGTTRHLGNAADRRVERAFLAQRTAEELDARVLDPQREVEQDAVGAEIGDIVGIEVLDRRIGAARQQRHPVIVRAHVHAPFVVADRGRCIADGGVLVVKRLVAPVVVEAASGIHAIFPRV